MKESKKNKIGRTGGRDFVPGSWEEKHTMHKREWCFNFYVRLLFCPCLDSYTVPSCKQRLVTGDGYTRKKLHQGQAACHQGRSPSISKLNSCKTMVAPSQIARTSTWSSFRSTANVVRMTKGEPLMYSTTVWDRFKGDEREEKRLLEFENGDYLRGRWNSWRRGRKRMRWWIERKQTRQKVELELYTKRSHTLSTIKPYANSRSIWL